jgi:hypothetical protein
MEIIRWVKFNGSEKKRFEKILKEEPDPMFAYNQIAKEFDISLLDAKEFVEVYLKKQ